ncbi:MAG TPA: bifunctional hydroxymethylpyrimidine kinase/phosphomethylpyrimidine kinase [Nitrososphaeraceae archaeon]|nr:bifunctional hydroxymethylpyrimidine kinase/phosphomethylpyrimidine kinase [Nitrososphaeraceae archaeon]
MILRSVLSIAGSDSSSGAGIQADLKTLSSLGTYGCSAITAITVQNTKKIFEVFPIPSEIVIRQINSVLNDIRIDAIKIGMVYDGIIINKIFKILKNTNIPIIVDPIFTSTSGKNLIKYEAIKALTKKILPIATIITPNINEATQLSGIDIKNKEDLVKSLIKMKKLGPKNVIVKGGHLLSEHSIDTLIDDKLNIIEFSNSRISIPENHGSGCNFSAALSAYISQGYEIPIACKLANEFMNSVLKNLLYIGKGYPVTDTALTTSSSAFKFHVIEELSIAINELEAITDLGKLIPETQSNFAYAIPNATSIKEVAGIKGRIVRIDQKVKASSCIEFGATQHIASAVISYMNINPLMRAGFNIKYDKKIIELLQSFMKVSEYDRRLEPQKLKEKEGYTIQWGVKKAILKDKEVRGIYHKGDIGKEPMIILFGHNPAEIVEYLRKLIEYY